MLAKYQQKKKNCLKHHNTERETTQKPRPNISNSPNKLRTSTTPQKQDTSTGETVRRTATPKPKNKNKLPQTPDPSEKTSGKTKPIEEPKPQQAQQPINDRHQKETLNS